MTFLTANHKARLTFISFKCRICLYVCLCREMKINSWQEKEHTWIFFFFDLCSLFCLSRGSARAQLRSSVPRWDSNHLILIQYWLQFCSQSGLFNYLAAVRNVLILHLVSFRESELQHEDFELWLPYLDLGQEDQRSINKYVFQDCIKSCEDTYSYT